MTVIAAAVSRSARTKPAVICATVWFAATDTGIVDEDIEVVGDLGDVVAQVANLL